MSGQERDALAQALAIAFPWWPLVKREGVVEGIGVSMERSLLPRDAAAAVLAAGWLPPDTDTAREAKIAAARRELCDTTHDDALRVSRAMIVLGDGGIDLLAALDRDRRTETGRWDAPPGIVQEPEGRIMGVEHGPWPTLGGAADD